jgi:hypothetical protein
MSKILIQRISSRKTNYRFVHTLILTTILITGFLIFHPIQAEATIVSRCQIVNPPTDPIDMNTVSFKEFVKTVHIEKEIFQCVTNNGAPVIVVVSLFTELFENMRTLSTINKTAETVTCIKGYNGTISYCDSKQIPIIDEYPVRANCDPNSLRTLDIMSPIEMETIVDSEGISKTIEAEKEVFQCDFRENTPTRLLDVILFTEIFEDITSGQIIKKSVESISCLKDIQTAEVKICSTKNHL